MFQCIGMGLYSLIIESGYVILLLYRFYYVYVFVYFDFYVYLFVKPKLQEKFTRMWLGVLTTLLLKY